MHPVTVPPPESPSKKQYVAYIQQEESKVDDGPTDIVPSPTECFPYVLVMQLPSLHQELLSKPSTFIYCWNCKCVLVGPILPEPEKVLFSCRPCMNCLFCPNRVLSAKAESDRVNANNNQLVRK